VKELRPAEVDAFIERWDDFHDAVVRAVDFDLERSTMTLDLRAQDGHDQWAWRAVRIEVEGLVEWPFLKPEQFDARVIFEAGVTWDGDRALLSLDTKSSSPPEEFRSSSLYFGGTTIRYDVGSLPE
jgi:hypothetical protein